MKRKLKHQYQQDEQSYLNLTDNKMTTTYDVGNPGSDLGQAKKI